MKKFILKAIISFFKAADSEFLKAMRFIAKSLGDNPDTFTGMTPTPEDGSKKLDNFAAAITAAESGDHAKVTFKNTLRLEIEDDGRTWANQVEVIAKNNPDIFAMSGFKFRKKRGPSIVLEAQQPPAVKRGEYEGSVKLHAKRTAGVNSFQFRYTDKDPATATEGDYVVLTQSKGKIMVEDLTLGKMYFFSVRVTGSLNTSDWSLPKAYRAY